MIRRIVASEEKPYRGCALTLAHEAGHFVLHHRGFKKAEHHHSRGGVLMSSGIQSARLDKQLVLNLNPQSVLRPSLWARSALTCCIDRLNSPSMSLKKSEMRVADSGSPGLNSRAREKKTPFVKKAEKKAESRTNVTWI